MPDYALPMEGGCRCGEVRFRITAPPLMEMACHCRGCQRMTASAFSTSLMVPSGSFLVVKGRTVRGGADGDVVVHQHCDRCKSWVFSAVRARPAVLNVRATLLDDPSPFRPWVEIQKAEALPWATTGAERSYERFPAEDFEALSADYRAARGMA